MQGCFMHSSPSSKWGMQVRRSFGCSRRGSGWKSCIASLVKCELARDWEMDLVRVSRLRRRRWWCWKNHVLHFVQCFLCFESAFLPSTVLSPSSTFSKHLKKSRVNVTIAATFCTFHQLCQWLLQGLMGNCR